MIKNFRLLSSLSELGNPTTKQSEAFFNAIDKIYTKKSELISPLSGLTTLVLRSK